MVTVYNQCIICEELNVLLSRRIGLVGSVHYVVEVVFETDKPEFGRALRDS